jgi:hypothetical protein
MIEDRPAVDIGDSELPATPCVRVHDYHHCECCFKSSRMGRHPNPGDEVLTRQCACLGLSIHGAYVGAWRIRQLQTETGGAHEFTQVWPLGG